MGETGLNSEKHVATSLGSKLEHIAFSVLYSMVSGNNDHSDLLNGVIMLFEDMQLISFAFSPEFYQHMPHWAMHVTNPLAYRPAEYSAFVILLGIVIGFLVLAVVCAVEVAMSFGSGKFAGASLLALKTLRLITSLLGTILFIPFLEILLAAVTCTGEQSHLREYPQVQCFSGAYSAQTIIVILSLLLFIPYNIAMSAIYLDTSPSRVNKASRTPIGRLDTIYAIARIFIVMIFTLTRTPALKIAFLIMVTFMLSVLIIRYQPFYISLYNELRAALFFAAASAAVVALISHLLKLDTIALPIATAASAPVGAIVGVFTCRRVYKTTINRVYRQIQVKHETLGKSPLGKSFQALGVPADPEINSTRDLSDDPELGDMFTGTSAIRDIHRITSTRTRPKTIHVFRHVGEVEIACRFVHNNRSPEALYIMEEIFGEGFEQFPKNALLKLVYAGYLEVFTDSTNQEPAYFVQLAKALKPAFDARFFIFMQDRILEQSKRTEGLNASTLNISSYVEFQTMQNGARRDHLATLIELRAFLSHIRNGQRGRDPKTYPIFLQRISEAEQRASEYYKKLIARWPKSKVLLRMYGSFLLQIKNERESASKYMLMAEEIEEIETRMSTAPVLQRHGSTRSSAKASQSLANLSSRTSLSRSNTLTKKVMSKPKTRLDTIMSPAESKVVDSDSDLSGLQGVPVVTLMQSPGAHISPEESVELDFDEEQPIQKSVSLVNTSQLRRRMSLSKYNEEEGDAGMGPQLSAETKGVGFNVAPSEDDPGFRENRMPSESNGGSTKSSEREAKLKLYNKLQLQTRLKEPVVRLDRDQKIMGSVYIVNIVVAFAIGLWSFSAAEGSIKGFARGTRLSRNMVYLTNAVRSFVRVADVSSDPQAQAASQAKFNDRHETFEGMMQNFSMYQLPYLAAFYADPRDIAVKISTYPLPVKTISHVNAYEVTKMTYQHGQAILSHG
ncbi:hypothetical protein DFJ77DRAFT_290500 [Powellomyces hirtus]|nr:hypothetical protein DFJ77DRAFT_290500 [Powellomyces hirtus]